MSVKASFSYCLLQYAHNPWLKERLNIGVLMYCEQHRFLRLKTRSWDGRISSAYPNMNRASFTEDLKQIERSVIRYSHGREKQPSLFYSSLSIEKDSYSLSNANSLEASKLDIDAETIASLVAPASDSSYRWAAGGTGICASPENKLHSLFDRFVYPYEVEKKAPKRSDDQVWSGVTKLLIERNLAERIEASPVVRTDLGSIKFQAGYQNGTFHVIQPLSFDLSDSDHIGAKAAKWAGYAQALSSSRRGQVTAQYLLGAPSSDELRSSFESAARYLRNFVGSENVYEEAQSETFVDKIEDDLRDHPQH